MAFLSWVEVMISTFRKLFVLWWDKHHQPSRVGGKGILTLEPQPHRAQRRLRWTHHFPPRLQLCKAFFSAFVSLSLSLKCTHPSHPTPVLMYFKAQRIASIWWHYGPLWTPVAVSDVFIPFTMSNADLSMCLCTPFLLGCRVLDNKDCAFSIFILWTQSWGHWGTKREIETPLPHRHCHLV